MIELRWVFDCETIEKQLQYRDLVNGPREWTTVPLIYESKEIFKDDIEKRYNR